VSAPVRTPADGALAGTLRALLGDAIAATGPAVVERRVSPYRSTHELEDVDLVLADGRRLRLVLKACGLAATHGVRPRIVMDGHRELWAYEALLPRLDLGAPRFFGRLDLGPDGERLVLERIAGEPLHLAGDLDAWHEAARWLARFHARGLEYWKAVAASGRALSQDPALHERWLARARRRAVTGEGATVWTEEIDDAARRAIRILADSPRTLVHGELYASNVIDSGTGAEPRVRVVDWESIGVGPAALDLAALTAGDWSDAVRGELVAAYRAAVGPDIARHPLFEPALDSARLVNALQWLGWSEGWSAPPHQARDWHSEARAAAARVMAAGEP